MGGPVFPPCRLTWGQTMVEVMKIMAPPSTGPMHALLHSVPSTLQQATADLYLHRRHSNTVLAQSLCGLWVLVYIRFVWALQVSLASMRFDSKCYFAPPTVLLWLLLCPWTWDIFFLVGSNIFLLMVVQQHVVILEFSQEKMSTRLSTPPSSKLPEY